MSPFIFLLIIMAVAALAVSAGIKGRAHIRKVFASVVPVDMEYQRQPQR